ncbi:MAG: acetyl-CoA acetyltransferase [Dehalococcoidia bacterium]|nr:acetyl-CoA acetyltransferase [Dehalococcoidia bacterium]
MANRNTVRGKVAVIGVGETTYYKRGQSPDPEFVLMLKAVLKACQDAGLDPREIDGFASYSDDRNSSIRLGDALGVKQINFSNMVWGGGGGGGSAAMANAAAGIIAGYADYVVAYRGLAQGQFGRFGGSGRAPAPVAAGAAAFTAPYGISSPGQSYAPRMMRYMHDHGVKQAAMRAVAMASYHHAQSNPNAVMRGRPLTEEMYDNSRWITEPFHLFDCCLENDGAAAVILTSAERARDFPHKPVYILGAAQGSATRNGTVGNFGAPTSNFTTLAPRLYAQAGVGPKDVDVLQSYENFTGGVVMSIVEHGFCEPEEVNEFFTTKNFYAPTGKLPLNTSGGNLAECYMHGLELNIEGVRQVRGDSHSQVPDVEISMVTSGPLTQPISNMIMSSERG